MPASAPAPGLVIAAPRSGSGKTTVALGLMRALTRGGLSVQPIKCGPDYIDPAFHAAAAGRPSYNLDSFAMGEDLVRSLVSSLAQGVRLVLAEGVMGLFDGVAAPGQWGRGSTADIASIAGWPVVLVMDVSGQGETAAAVALGCASYRRDVRIAGVVLNRVASARQEAAIVPAVERAGFPVLGCIGRNDDLTLPERHLGLVQASETDDLDARLDAIADAVEAGLRLYDFVALAAPAFPSGKAAIEARPALDPPGQRIALAQDRAFAFMYPHILSGWRARGAEIIPFSPLADEPPDPRADAVWLPGGYPELHGGALAAARRFRDGLKRLAAGSLPIHGECGGYMALGAGLEDEAGGRHEMAGLLGVETSFARRKLHLGYRRARLIEASPLGPAGAVLYGHEYHYATLVASEDAPLADVEDAAAAPQSERGSRRGTVTGTFFHVIDRAMP